MVWAKVKEDIWLIILLGAALLLYSHKLALTPVHLNQDELMFALNARAIAESGQDYYGNFLPFYFFHLNSFWATPIAVYLASIFMYLLPIDEANIRLATVAVAIFSTALIYLILDNVFKSKMVGLIGGLLFVSTPALFINSRLLLDNVFPIPFVLLWLFWIQKFSQKNISKYLFLSGLVLGIGWHSYHAAHIMMPVYFIVGLLYISFVARPKLESYVVYFAGAIIPILVFVPWLIQHPDTLISQVSYVGSLDKSVEVSQGVVGVFNLGRLESFVGNYFSYFSPKILFFEGDRSLIHSTRQVGVFLYPVAFLLIFGVMEIVRRKDLFGYLLLLGFLSYPVAPAIVNEAQRVSRGLVVIPFLILISVYGVRFVFRQKDRVFGFLFAFLILIGLLQFGYFWKDYFGDYRTRSYGWFRKDIGGAFGSAMEFSEKQPVEAVYVDTAIHFGEFYYDFYEKKLGIKAQEFKFFDPSKTNFKDFEKGSLVILDSNNFKEEYQAIEVIRTTIEPDGKVSFYVYYLN